jgi:transketolase
MSDAMESTRVAFLETLTELMEADPKTVVVFADSVKVFRATAEFLHKFAGRVFDVGIAEQNMVATAAGLATCGLTVFAATYAGFITMRACEQVRTRGVSGPEREVHRRECGHLRRGAGGRDAPVL